MNTVEEIEAAIEALPPEKVAEVFAWLQTRKAQSESPTREVSRLGFMKGKIILKPGWDEPLEDFKEYME